MSEREQYQGKPAEGYKPLAEWGEVEALSDEELEAWKRSPVERPESRVIATIARLQERVEDAEARLALEQASFRDCDLFLVAAIRERDALQARVEEAARKLERCERGWNKSIKQAEGFLALAERRKEALEWYASPEAHRWGPAGREPDIIFDKGDRARAAIEEAHPG